MGIIHFEDQPIEEFLDSVGNLNRLIALEKLDGANMQIGVDDEGKLFTSREQKGTIEDRYYTPKDWGTEAWTVGFRSAHEALEKVRGTFLKNLRPGDVIDCEVIYGPQPNAIRYSDSHNFVVMLRPFSGEPNINRLKEVLEDKDINVVVSNIIYSDDGINFKHRTENQTWQFSQTPKVPHKKIEEIINDDNIKNELIKLGEYLKKESSIKTPLNGTISNAQILTIKLNLRPVDVPAGEWTALKNDIKAEKEIVMSTVQNMKLTIKKVMIDKLLRKIGSKFGPTPENGGWIEGVVFIDPENSKMFKVVDKDKFTKLNKFNWAVRAEVQNRILNPSFEKLAADIGHAPLGKKQHRKLYLSQNGDNSNKAIHNIAKTIDNVNKSKLINTIHSYQKLLKEFINTYKNKKETLKISNDDGSEHTYNDVIDNRTLGYFAEINRDYSKMIYYLNSNNFERFVSILAKTSLGDD